MTQGAPADRPLTLSDIAKLAGVSRSAASRALDRDRPTGGPSAARVRAVAQEHGYIPNTWAANLRRQRSGVVGLVVPRLTDTVMAMLCEALSVESAARGLRATVATTGDDPRTELAVGRALVVQRVDGLVLTTARTDGADPLLTELSGQDVRVSLALRTDGTTPSALLEDETGGYLATRHLIEHGHRRIAYVGGPAYASTTQQREAGYRRAMAEARIPVAPELVHHADFSMEAGADVGRRLLALAEVPSGVFSANDSMAVGLLAVAQRAGMHLPDDLSVVGYNDTPLASNLAVPLSSVHVPFDRVAADALDLLLGSSGEQQRRAPVHLVERESVAIA